MSNPLTPYLPDLRRIVTTHDERGVAIVQSDLRLSAEVAFELIASIVLTRYLGYGNR
jgi:hypothetical protein